MLKIYIIGSNRFNGLKGVIYKALKNAEGVAVLAVGFSPVYDFVLRKEDYDTLHDLENKSIEESDIIIIVDNEKVGGISYVGEDTSRELSYSRILGKTIWTSDMLFSNYLKIKGQH